MSKKTTLEDAKKNFEFKIASLTITPESIITVLQYAMEAVEVTTLTGEEKKAAVIDILEQAVLDSPMYEHIKRSILQMIEDGIVSHMIDIIVSASRGKLNLNGVSNASQILCTNVVPHFGRCITSCLSKKKPEKSNNT